MPEDIFGLVGTTQGAFSVERVVAHGGFGVIYRAYHGAFRAPVALKCLKVPGTLPGKLRAQFLEQFREEAEMLFRLSAAIPAVVRPLHHDVISLASGTFVPFIALEWLEGKTLASFIESRAVEGRPPLGLEEAVELLSPVARALEASHNFPSETGPICVIHRDLKPANIFLATVHGAQSVKILDFGIARSRDAASVMAGQTASTSGAPVAFTPRYGAPEQWAPKRYGATGPWTDVWGLALTTMELIVGRPIIEGNHLAVMGTILDERRRPTPRSEGVVVPDSIEALFRRALAVDPRDRPKDAGVFWDELEQGLGLELSAPPIALPNRPVAQPVRARRSLSPAAAANAPTELATPEPGEAATPAPSPAAPEAAAAPSPTRPPPKPSSPPPVPTPDPGLYISVDWAAPAQRRGLPPPARPAPPKPAPPPVRPAPRPLGADTTTTMNLKSVFGLPLRLAGAGILITIVDQVATSFLLGGQRIGIGPFRLLWLAVALVLIGIAIALARLFGTER